MFQFLFIVCSEYSRKRQLKEYLLGHLLLRGLHSSEEKLRERIIIDEEGQELKDSKISSLTASSEMYLSFSRKGETINRVESKRGAGGSDSREGLVRRGLG